ncbi:hypothetical protein [Chryseobacterium sp.]|uniref:hypothetical protein n=1 Tax=Chryseobacterium sp. TaxID=1871047 RepID=UPI00289662E7|nr:hypothetical protein [Chryseobacterium sp.]
MEKFVNRLKKLISKITLPIADDDDAIQTKEEIITLIEKIFLNSEERQFQTILINYIIKPLYSKFSEIEPLQQFSSRSKRKIVQQHQQIKPLIESLFESYNHFLKEEKEYIQYQDNLSDREKDLMDLIFKKLDYDADSFESYNLKASKIQILRYLTQLSNESSYIDLKYRVGQIHTKIKDVKRRLTNELNKIYNEIKNTTIELNSDIDYPADYHNYTYKEILEENLLEYKIKQSFYTNHFKLIDNLEKNLEKKFPFIIKDKTISQLIQFLPHEKINRFLEFEDRLIEHKYLIKNEINLKWIRKKNELVNFCRFLELEGFLKPHKKLSILIQYLENRYDFGVGDQRKESKFNGSTEEIKSDYEFLNF